MTETAAGGTVRDAERAADSAARACGVRVRVLRGLAEFQLAHDLFESVWGPANAPVTRDMMRALGKAGNYLSGAFQGEELVGACVAFFGPPAEASMHSHVAAVSAAVRGRDVGFALKLHQRAWALGHGVTRVSWTYDPLVRRNAYFNLGKLAVTAAAYMENFYGPMLDTINTDDESDRLVVDWELLSDPVVQACHGKPVTVDLDGADVGLSPEGRITPAAGPRVLVAVPADVEKLRQTDPAAALAWRYSVRTVLGGLLRDGARVTGFARAGWYVVERPSPQAA